MSRLISYIFTIAIIIMVTPGDGYSKTLVTAYAYNTVRSQTDSTPNITSTGKRPETSASCAVSLDLFKKYKNKKIRLSFPDGSKPMELKVNDSMKKTYRRSVDICFGKNIKAAKKFGKKKKVILEIINEKTR